MKIYIINLYFFYLNNKHKVVKRLIVNLPWLIICMLINIPSAKAENSLVELGTIVISPKRIPTEISRTTQSVYVIGHEEIKQTSAHSVEELLQYVHGVDIRRRGIYGVQSDVSIRGSTYEQVLILIDGVKVTDSQTGHHNMDLPVTLEDIERIEVVRGAGSSVYGANAFGGVINIITKKPEGKKIILETVLGEHSLSKQTISVSHPLWILNNRFSFEHKESSGYRPETNFEILNFYFTSLAEFEEGFIEYSFGYVDKDFGADSFYSNLYPQEEEHTDTRFMNVRSEIGNDTFKIKPLIYYRRHQDKYILDRTRPWFYTNYHTTYSYGGELQTNLDLSLAKLAFGLEIGEEEITSTNLGDHSRLREALFMECEPKINDKLLASFGIRVDHYDDWDWEISPSFGVGYFLTPEWKVRSSVARAFRVPTFTDLYYRSPANIGNQNLTPEECWSYEIGTDYMRDWYNCGISIFRREGRDLIDWVRATTNDPWQARNVGKIDTDGVEIDIKIYPKEKNEDLPISLISLGYSYLYSQKDESSLLSKYVMDYLKHQFTSSVSFDLPFGVEQMVRLSYEERINQRHYFLLDTKISKELKSKHYTTKVFINVTNLLNTSYDEVAGVPMPGRWAECGMRVEF